MHIYSNHLVCRVCNVKQQSIVDLKQHLTEVHDGRQYQCKYCLSFYQNQQARDGHEARHTGKYAFRCSICTKGYVSNTNLLAHISAVHTKVETHKNFQFQIILFKFLGTKVYM